MFVIFNECFVAELLPRQSIESDLQLCCVSSKCKLAFRKLIFCYSIDEMEKMKYERTIVNFELQYLINRRRKKLKFDANARIASTAGFGLKVDKTSGLIRVR